MRLAFGQGELGGAGEPYRRGDVLGAGSAAAILRAAVHQRLDMSSATNEERADSLRRSELVSGYGEKIELLLLCVDRDLTEGLHRIGVDERSAILCCCGQLRNGLNRSDLVVDPHHRAHGDFIVDDLRERRGIYHPIRGHRQEALLCSFVRSLMDGAEDCLVLDWGCHDCLATLRLESAPGAEDGEIIRLSTARGKANFVRPGS